MCRETWYVPGDITGGPQSLRRSSGRAAVLLGLEQRQDLLLFFDLTVEVLELAFEARTLDPKPGPLALDAPPLEETHRELKQTGHRSSPSL